jgi:hypothetical protein
MYGVCQKDHDGKTGLVALIVRELYGCVDVVVIE